MLHFNDLRYYAVPSLPKSWTAPTWLKIELGIFAGRLYFEYTEYSDLCKFLGVRESEGKLEELDSDELLSAEQSAAYSETREAEDDTNDETETDPKSKQLQSFTAKPLTFLHEWLAVRRKGQDFAHTPMGYVCQGKPLTANHPFFSKVETNEILKQGPVAVNGLGKWSALSGDIVEADFESDEVDEGFDDDAYYDDGDECDDREDETELSV